MRTRHRTAQPRQLEHFAEVVERGSFTRAAAALGLTQPALTRSIRQLENDLGARLLERGRFGARPTELGQAIALHGRAVGTSFQRAREDVAEWHKGRRGSLSIGATAGVAADLLPRAALAFANMRPLVGLQIVEGPADAMIERLQIRTLDIFIGPLGAFEPGAQASGIVRRHLTDYHMVIVGAPNHPIARRRRVSRRDLEEHSWLLPGRGSSLRRQVENVMAQMRLALSRPALEVDSFSATLRLLTLGGRLAILPAEMVRHEIETRRLATIKASLPAVIRPIGFFHRSPIEYADLLEEFLSCLTHEIAVARSRSLRGTRP